MWNTPVYGNWWNQLPVCRGCHYFCFILFVKGYSLCVCVCVCVCFHVSVCLCVCVCVHAHLETYICVWFSCLFWWVAIFVSHHVQIVLCNVYSSGFVSLAPNTITVAVVYISHSANSFLSVLCTRCRYFYRVLLLLVKRLPSHLDRLLNRDS